MHSECEIRDWVIVGAGSSLGNQLFELHGECEIPDWVIVCAGSSLGNQLLAMIFWQSNFGNQLLWQSTFVGV